MRRSVIPGPRALVALAGVVFSVSCREPHAVLVVLDPDGLGADASQIRIVMDDEAAAPIDVDGIEDGQASAVLAGDVAGTVLVAVDVRGDDDRKLAEAFTTAVLTPDGGRATARLFAPCRSDTEDPAAEAAACALKDGAGTGRCRDGACSTASFCGDAQAQGDEACDLGADNVDPAVAVAGDCRADCTVARCGDQRDDADEECDDGNIDPADGCSPLCTDEFCGDGVVSVGEDCEPATPGVTVPCAYATADAPLCSSCDGNACLLVDLPAPYCSDGITQGAFGETCDDGNLTSFDGCSAACNGVIWGPVSVGPSIDVPIVDDHIGITDDLFRPSRVLLATSGTDLIAVDAMTGTEQWVHTLPEPPIGGPSAFPQSIPEDYLSAFTVATATTLRALDAETGLVLGPPVTLAVPPAAGPFVAQFFRMFVLFQDTTLRGYPTNDFDDPQSEATQSCTGCTLCSATQGPCQPALVHNGLAGNMVLALDEDAIAHVPSEAAGSCVRRFSLNPGERVVGAVTVIKDHAVARTTSGRLVRFDLIDTCGFPDAPARDLAPNLPATFVTNVVLIADANGSAIAGADDGTVWSQALNIEYPRALFTLGSVPLWLAVDAESDLYVIDDANVLHKRSAITGFLRFTVDVEALAPGFAPVGAPLVSGAAIYLASTDGRLIALEGGGSVGDPLATWSRDLPYAGGAISPTGGSICGAGGAASPLLVALIGAAAARRRRRAARPRTTALILAPMLALILALCALSGAAAAAPSTSQQALARARAASAALDFELVVSPAQAVLADAAATPTERVEAAFLLGSAYATMGQDVEAEQPFRLLLRARPDFAPDPNTPPKIMQVFAKVQADERRTRDIADRYRRDAAMRALAPRVIAPDQVQGGSAVDITVEMNDDDEAHQLGERLRTVSIRYRRQQDPAYSALALGKVDGDNTWRGSIPAAATASDVDTQLLWFVEIIDGDGSVLGTIGTDTAPSTAPLSAGDVEVPVTDSPWFWGVAIGAGVVVAAAGAVVGVLAMQQATALPESDLGTVRTAR